MSREITAAYQMNKGAKIVKYLKHTPTAAQQSFCNQIADFLTKDEPYKCFILRGYAGTGKTTSLAALVQALPSFHLRSVLLAPTGRAAKVMGSYSKKKAYTIHKRIYRKRAAVSHEMSFQLAPNLLENTIFIVDEASMVTDEWSPVSGSSLLKDLIKHVYQLGVGGRSKNCFLLFVGDSAQLPPVGSLQSPALNAGYLSENFSLKTTAVELTEVVRQEEESGILANATQLRKMISRNRGNLIPKFTTKDFSDIFSMHGGKLAEGLDYAYRKFGMENTLVICRSNKSANQYNQHIRLQLLYREEELTGGDQIMIVKNNYFWLPENDSADFIANGDMARIVKVRGEEDRFGLRFAEVQLELTDFPEAGIITCKVILDTLHAETPNLPSMQSQQLYEGVALEYEHIKNKPLRMKAIKDDPYFNALQIKFSYATTCHKAQGGQWDAVFVDQGYLTEEMIDIDFLRWLYTAITRASKELFLVNFTSRFFKEPVSET